MNVKGAVNKLSTVYKLEALGIAVIILLLSSLITLHFCSNLTIAELIQSSTLSILVLVTLWYAKSTFKLQTVTEHYTATTQKIFEVSRNAEINSAAPIISLNLAIVDSEIHVEYDSIGRGPALNLRVWLRSDDNQFSYLESDKEKNATYRPAVGVGQSGSHVWIAGMNRPLPTWQSGLDVLAEYRDIFQQDFKSRLAVAGEDDQTFHYGKKT